MPGYTQQARDYIDVEQRIKNYKDELTLESYQMALAWGVPGNGTTRNDAQDAFRHAYSSAIVAYEYNRIIAYTAGEYNEWKYPDLPNVRYMDTYNNEIGRQIGIAAGSREEIAQKVYDALTRGELIIDPQNTSPSSPFSSNTFDNPFSNASNDSHGLLDKTSADFNFTAFSPYFPGVDYNDIAFSNGYPGVDFNWTAFSGGGAPAAASSPFDLTISDYSRWFD